MQLRNHSSQVQPKAFTLTGATVRLGPTDKRGTPRIGAQEGCTGCIGLAGRKLANGISLHGFSRLEGIGLASVSGTPNKPTIDCSTRAAN